MREFELIEAIRRKIGAPGRGTVVGIGDDAAVYEPPGGLELFTSDAFVEDVHFRRDYSTFLEIGAKCMVANVSDIAAMGGFPTRATVSLAVPSDVGEEEIGELYDGLIEVAKKYAVEIVGGDIVGSPSGLVVAIALVGAADGDRVVLRGGAVVGDAVLVTGELGGAQAGLIALEKGLPSEGDIAKALARHRLPAPRVAEAQALLDVATPHSMIDISDGLGSEVWHIADESGVGIELWEAKIPVSPGATEVAKRLGLDDLDLAVSSGEEFELVVTVPPSEVDRAIEHVTTVTGTPLSWVGKVVAAGEGCRLERGDGTFEPLGRTGYEHLTD